MVRNTRFHVPAGLPSKDIHAAKGCLRAEVIATAMSAGNPDR